MKAIAFLAIFMNVCNAQDLVSQIWSNRNEHYLFSLNSHSQILISSNCLTESQSLEKSKCEAAIALSKKNIEVPSENFTGGKNPGAVACTIGLNQKVVVLKDSQNNENAFCKFEDGSMIAAINLQTILK